MIQNFTGWENNGKSEISSEKGIAFVAVIAAPRLVLVESRGISISFP
jgi:hypothetical protein